MKRFTYFIVIVLVLCVATVSFARYMDSEKGMERPSDGAMPNSSLIADRPVESALPISNPPERERPTSQPATDAPQTSKSSDNILLVNPDNPLPENYLPENLVDLYKQKNRHFQLASADIELCKPVFEAMDAMFVAAQQDGINGFIITSGYRSHEKQKEVFATSAEGIAANPGESEHETGLAFDVTAMGNENFELTPQFEWLSEHCAEYGFIIRYPKGMEDVTGFPYEPWHYRYVGVPYAKDIMDAGITLEEYLQKQ